MRRREQSQRTRRDAITSLAIPMFLEKGFAASTMSEVAKQLGGSKSTLWTYFLSKERLFEAAIKVASSRLIENAGEVLDRSRGDVRSALTGFYEDVGRRFTTPDGQRLMRLVFAEAERHPRVSEIFYANAIQPILDRLTRYLSGELAGHVGEAEEMARAFCRMAMEPVQSAVWRSPLSSSDHSHRDRAITAFLHYYIPLVQASEGSVEGPLKACRPSSCQ